MEVVFLSDIPRVGQKGESKHVSYGYARNFLFPRGLALPISDPRARSLFESYKKSSHVKERSRTELIQFTAELEGKQYHLSGKASPSGVLYASIGAQEVNALLKSPFPFEMESLKNIGTHRAMLDFGHGVSAGVNLVIEAQKKGR